MTLKGKIASMREVTSIEDRMENSNSASGAST
jgi:hypothetical protein